MTGEPWRRRRRRRRRRQRQHKMQELAALTLRVQEMHAQLGVPPAAPAPQAEDELCVLCLDAPKDHIILPCGHQCVCKGVRRAAARTITSSASRKHRKVPRLAATASLRPLPHPPAGACGCDVDTTSCTPLASSAGRHS